MHNNGVGADLFWSEDPLPTPGKWVDAPKPKRPQPPAVYVGPPTKQSDALDYLDVLQRRIKDGRA